MHEKLFEYCLNHSVTRCLIEITAMNGWHVVVLLRSEHYIVAAIYHVKTFASHCQIQFFEVRTVTEYSFIIGFTPTRYLANQNSRSSLFHQQHQFIIHLRTKIF